MTHVKHKTPRSLTFSRRISLTRESVALFNGRDQISQDCRSTVFSLEASISLFHCNGDTMMRMMIIMIFDCFHRDTHVDRFSTFLIAFLFTEICRSALRFVRKLLRKSSRSTQSSASVSHGVSRTRFMQRIQHLNQFRNTDHTYPTKKARTTISPIIQSVLS